MFLENYFQKMLLEIKQKSGTIFVYLIHRLKSNMPYFRTVSIHNINIFKYGNDDD
jgi:hypothetical protein